MITETIDDIYIKELNNSYWAEEAEMKAGIHPSQVSERILEVLHFTEVNFCEITYLDWTFEDCRVGVSLDGKFYGVYDYLENKFESTPDERLTETLESLGFGLNDL